MAAAGPSSSAPPRPGAGVATMVAGRRGDSAAGGRGALHGRRGGGAMRLQATGDDLVSPFGRGDRQRRLTPGVASGGGVGEFGGDEVGDDGGGLRLVPRRRPSSLLRM
ncbi:hypothetical protein OsJ_08831 [Oryza sativa Japonica Group]|uniref:Uncharacterized protein n=1 Tax=Oryza sativa subsp. japonica TaxID=39947 RepID=B9F461_ORYSJ|nr:hypothetical protein OsJ_08831 [Oryza sativa Japonica Group]